MASTTNTLLWLVIAVACQFLWGTYPAAVRYMQTKSKTPPTSLQLSLLINLLACPALFFGNTVPFWIHKKFFSRRGGAAPPTLPHNGVADKPPTGPSNGKPARFAGAQDSALAEPLLGPDGAAADGAEADVEAAPAAAPVANGVLHPAPNGLPPPIAFADEPPPPAAEPTRPAPWKVLCLTTLFLSTLFLCQVFSLLFTTAYLSQMVFLLAPVIVALMAKALFKSPLPPGLWPALFLMLLGCGMVIGSKAMNAGKPKNVLVGDGGALTAATTPGLWGGRAEEAWLCTAMFGEKRGAWLCGLELGQQEGWEEEGEAGSDSGAADGAPLAKKPKPHPKPPPKPHDEPGIGMRDMLGIGLSLLGAIALASFMTTVQRAHGAVSDQTVLYCNFLFQLPICFTLTFTLEHDRFHQLFHLGAAEYLEIFGMAAGVNWFANWVQQMCIRNLGAPQAAAFLPVRLLGSLAASYPLLNEGLVGPLQWGGAGLLLAAVSWYLVQQKKAAALGSRSTAALIRAEATAPVYVA